MHLFSKKQILKGNTHSHRIPLLIQNNLGCCNSSCVTQNRIFVFMQGIQNSNIMQRGGTDIQGFCAQSKSTNSYFLQLARSKPRAFRTYSENYLQRVFSRNYLTPSSYFVYYTKNQCQILQVLSNKSVSYYPSSSEHRFILICVTTERPLV